MDRASRSPLLGYGSLVLKLHEWQAVNRSEILPGFAERGCINKQGFFNRADAVGALRKMAQRNIRRGNPDRSDYFVPYKCDCGEWHLGHIAPPIPTYVPQIDLPLELILLGYLRNAFA